MLITSTKNDQIKYLKLLQGKSKVRQEDQCFVIEGIREIQLALSNGIKVNKVYINPSIYVDTLNFQEGTEVIELSDKVYQYIAYRSSTEGILGIGKTPPHRLKDLKLNTTNPLIIVLESPEKPGNIGAILRTADAAGADAVLIANPRTDLYNPNSIRSSLGAIFSNQIAVGTSEDIIAFLTERNIRIYAATLQNSNSYLNFNYREASAFAMGSEANGLSVSWRNRPDIQAVNIPMYGEIDSMNLSVSTAILTYEAVRQRQ